MGRLGIENLYIVAYFSLRASETVCMCLSWSVNERAVSSLAAKPGREER